MAMNVEAESRDLKRRVGETEGSFGFLTQQVTRHIRQERLAKVATVSAEKKLALEQAKLAKAEDNKGEDKG